ncbi:phage tail protein [Paraburkholderia azotifigens]|uniref:phage tail protein n=1 Tax=Paraburkholderia azotifigens TaxID=2057004 RepID=UPI00316EE509
MTKIFMWSPCVQAQGQTRYVVRVSRFGDGYSQVIPFGRNNVAQVWHLSFCGSGNEINNIQAFLDETKGSESFTWSPPLRSPGRFRVDAARGVTVHAQGGDIYTLEATFEEVFAP